MSARKRVTIVSIAEKLGLSPTTVGFVLRGQAGRVNLSEDTVKRVRKAAKEMGYVPNMLARGLRRQKTGVVGLLLPDLSMNWAEMLHMGMSEVLDEAEYAPFIVMHRWQPKRQAVELNRLVRHQVDGIGCVPIAGCQDIYREYAESGTPFLLVGDTLPGLEGVNVVGWDSEAAAETAVKHLVERGCRRLGCVGPRDDTVMTGRRFAAFGRVVERSAANTRDAWIARWDTATWLPSVTDGWVRNVFGGTDRPDGIFALNDGTAMPLLQSLARAGIRVPEDVAVVGMGDLPLAGVPGLGLTTVREPVYEMGAAVARMMLGAIREGEDGGEVWLRDAKLVARRTTEVPPDHAGGH